MALRDWSRRTLRHLSFATVTVQLATLSPSAIQQYWFGDRAPPPPAADSMSGIFASRDSSDRVAWLTSLHDSLGIIRQERRDRVAGAALTPQGVSEWQPIAREMHGMLEQLPARLVDVHLHVWDSLPRSRTFRDSLLAAFRRYHLESAVASGDLAEVRALAALAPDRVLAGVSYGPGLTLPTTEDLRSEFHAGRLAVFGEIDAAWLGEPLSGSHLAPYWDLVEAVQVPVAVFTGVAPAGTSFRACCTGYRATAARLQDVEEVLVRHPGLRMDLMQAGWPYREQTIALMHSYPELYADLGNLAGNATISREEFYDYLHALVRTGLGKRLMFGSGLSAQEWAAKIGPIVEEIQAAPFLSEEQRADIFYRNAERFLSRPRLGSPRRAP